MLFAPLLDPSFSFSPLWFCWSLLLRYIMPLARMVSHSTLCTNWKKGWEGSFYHRLGLRFFFLQICSEEGFVVQVVCVLCWKHCKSSLFPLFKTYCFNAPPRDGAEPCILEVFFLQCGALQCETVKADSGRRWIRSGAFIFKMTKWQYKY